MNRRAFVCGGMSVALLTTLAAEAEPAVKVYVIGILANNPWPAIDALRQGLESLGYREGRHLRYEYRWAGGDERFPGLASDLARLKVDTIVTWGTPAALAAKNATATIPIVMVLGDPVRVGIVSNLARPGGNGRVERWRADRRVRWRFHDFRRGPQSGSLDHVSSALPKIPCVEFSPTRLKGQHVRPCLPTRATG